MFNILDFIDSPDIREYNRNTVFTPAEQAILIGQSEETTVEEKLSAWQELVDVYSTEEFQVESIRINKGIHVADFREMVIDNIRIWKETIASTRSQDNVVYALTYGERESGSDGRTVYFSNYDLAYDCFAQTKSEYIEKGYNEELYAKIKRIYLDGESGAMDTFFIDNELRLVMIRPDSKRFVETEDYEIADILEACYVHVPLPFRKGDIVKIHSLFWRTEYGVIPFNQKDKENDICMKYGGDGTDITVSLDTYLDWRDEFDYTDATPSLALRYCSAEELPEKQKILEKLSQARKGEIDWYSLLMKE